MRGITPHLWFDNQAREAAEFYTATFPESEITDVTTIHDTPSGDADVVSFILWRQPFMAISAGPAFTFNPSTSFLVSCGTSDEVDALWAALSAGGTPLMELGAYPFSSRYGWVQDKYGLSWQVMVVDGDDAPRQRITPTLLFVGDVAGKAEDAIIFYTSVFADSAVGAIDRWGDQESPEVPGTVKHASFVLAGHDFAAMDSSATHDFAFNEAISFMVMCESQQEIDRYWEQLSAVPEAEACGWVKDRYGVSWQVTHGGIEAMLRSASDDQRARVTQAFLGMKKFDIAELERAYVGVGVAETARD